jgi:hypothetical protein
MPVQPHPMRAEGPFAGGNAARGVKLTANLHVEPTTSKVKLTIYTQVLWPLDHMGGQLYSHI